MSKSCLTALSAGLWICISGGPAICADIPLRAPAAASASWTGFYLGASVGARIAENNWRTTDITPNASLPGAPVVSLNATEQTFTSAEARFGGYAGYNWQLTSRWVASIEGYGGFANNRQTFNPIPGTVVSWSGIVYDPPSGQVQESWDAGVRARLGYLLTPSTMVYASGGTNWMQGKVQVHCPPSSLTSLCSVDEGTPTAIRTMIGWTVGAGFEYRMTSNWAARVDYQYADYGEFSHAFFRSGSDFDDRFTANVRIHTHTATIGVGYTF